MSKLLTLDASLKQVLSQANADQNQHYPPHVFDIHFNLVTKFLLGEIIKLWPTNNTIKMLAKPFLKTKVIPVKDGLIEFPEEFWNFLNASIYLNGDNEACEAIEITPEEAINARLKKRENSRLANEVDQKMWEYLIDHSYKFPTLEKPIICMFEAEGYRIYPYNVPSVQFTWLREPKEYKYGYTMNPDDTYQYDVKNGGVESEWEDSASEYIFKGMNVLYSAYVRDVEQSQWAQLLNQNGIF